MDLYFGGQTEPGSWRWMGSWSWDVEPFKFRVLFHGIVDAVAHLLSFFLGRSLETYWLSVILCSLVSIAFAAVTLAYLLGEFGLDRRARLACLGLWTLLPPVHMGFVIPVQTKEDFLAYGIFHLGLIAVLTKNFRHAVILSIVGALTREPLLLIPLLYAFVVREGRAKALVPLALAIAVHLALRAVLGSDGYGVLSSDNFEHILLPFVAFAIVLGYGWVALLQHYRPRNIWLTMAAVFSWFHSTGESHAPDSRKLLWRAMPLVTIALLGAHFTMGRVVEIRISFLLAPWAVLANWAQVEDKRVPVKRLMIPAAFVILVAMGEVLGLTSRMRDMLNPSLDAFAARHLTCSP